MNELYDLYKKVFSIFIIVLSLFFVCPLVFGYKLYAIETNSMEPTIATGSIVYIRDIKFINLRLNDIITFEQSNKTITHRVVGIDEINNQLTTKGDHLLYNDENKVSVLNVRGKVEYSIPFIGYVLIFFKSIEGIIMGILLVILFIASLFVPKMKKGQDNDEKDK